MIDSDDSAPTPMLLLAFMTEAASRERQWRSEDYPPVPKDLDPLCGDLACECELATSDAGIQKTMSRLKRGPDPAESQDQNHGDTPEASKGMQGSPEPCGNVERSGASEGTSSMISRLGGCILRRGRSLSCASGSEVTQAASKPKASRKSKWCSSQDMLQARELGLCNGKGFSPSQKCHMVCDRRLPTKPVQKLMK